MRCGDPEDEGVRLSRRGAPGVCRHAGRLDRRALEQLPHAGGDDETTPVGVLVARRLVVEGRHRGLRGMLAHRARYEARGGY